MTLAVADPFSIAADIIDPPEWEPEGRPPLEPHHVPPLGTWNLWLLEAGRGAGKTEACARYFTKYMRANPGHRGRIIAPTYDDAVESCVKGHSGLLAIDPDVRFVVQPGGSKVLWPNGSEALCLGTPFPRDVDRLRAAGNRHIDWWEEMAANAQLGKAWDQAAFGLRLGSNPHSIGSTTPRNTEAYKTIRKLRDTVLTKASMFDNPHNPKSWVAMMKRKYQGTRLGRQELAGELLDDVPGALWVRRMVEAMRTDVLPEMTTVAVAVDPAATSGLEADDTGIVAGGIGTDGHVYVVHDRTCHLAPAGWGKRVVNTYHQLEGDYVVGEVNNGGEMVQHVISTVDARVPFKSVHATRGKQVRAQPVASLCGDPDDTEGNMQPRVHLYGTFPTLEDQMCNWDPDSGDDSPDNMDAFVWLVTSLLLEPEEETQVVEYYEPERIGADV
jgi:phage terminase large subunit-like protein